MLKYKEKKKTKTNKANIYINPKQIPNEKTQIIQKQ